MNRFNSLYTLVSTCVFILVQLIVSLEYLFLYNLQFLVLKMNQDTVRVNLCWGGKVLYEPGLILYDKVLYDL